MDRWVSVEGRFNVYTRLMCVFMGLVIDAMLTTAIIPLIPHWVSYTNCPNTTCPETISSVSEIDIYSLSIMFASSQMLSIIAMPLSGILCETIGFDLPLIIGLSCQTCSALCFAFGERMAVYVIARLFHGVGSVFIGTTGHRYIAECANVPRTRDWLFATVYCLYGFTCLGPVYSGVAYYLYSQLWCFLPFAIVSALSIVILVAVTRVQTNVSDSAMMWYRHADENISCGEIMLDPYVIITAFGIAVSLLPEACLGPTIALWIQDMYAWPSWKLGLMFLPTFVCYELSILTCVVITSALPKHCYMFTVIGFIVGGGSFVAMATAQVEWIVVCALALMTFTLTTSKFCLVAILASIGRTRFSSAPGRILSVFKLSAHVPFVIGPIIALPMDVYLGFPIMCVTMATLNLVVSPLVCVLRQIPSPYSASHGNQNENERLIEDKGTVEQYTDDVDDETSLETPKETSDSEQFEHGDETLRK